MDSQRRDFSKLIASQFEYLDSNDVCPRKLEQEFQKLQPQRAKLHDFCESVVESLVLPRFKIVESQLGNRASFESVASDVILRVAPSPEQPSEAKFRLNYEIFIPARSITFEFVYRIITNHANHSSDGWKRFTIPSFNQNEYCKWLEDGIVCFINSFMNAPKESRGDDQ